METTLYIKNMVCDRCRMAVRSVLQKRGFHPVSIELGIVRVEEIVSDKQRESLREDLSVLGFELLDDSRHQIIDRIKTIVIENIHFSDGANAKENFSGIIARELHRDYSFLSNLFSEAEGKTIEQFIIQQKIEKVKELLVYDELSLSEIADKLGYSSVAYLSGQFKKVTGLTPTQFKNLEGNKGRKTIDSI